MKVAGLFLLSCLILWVVGCGSHSVEMMETSQGDHPADEEVGEVFVTAAEAREGDFVYRLVTEKETYTIGETVVMYAELEYIGDQKEMSISHAASPFYFPMTEQTRGYDIIYGLNQPLLRTTLEKGVPLREGYEKSGGYGSEDGKDYVAFMKKFIKSGFLSGIYVVNGYANFYVEAGEERTDYHIAGQIRFQVK